MLQMNAMLSQSEDNHTDENKDARRDATQRLNQLMDRGRQFLGCDTAILAGAMTWVSERTLVSAISNNGGFGVIACGAMTPDLLSQEIEATRRLTSQPFGVNLITMHPDLTQLMDVCLDHKVSHVVLAGGFPKAKDIAYLKGKNGQNTKVICFTPTLSLGKRLIKNGADALVIEGMEAGGHTGPVSTAVLAQEILPHIKEVPVFVAGGIGRGDAILAYLEMGASGCQLGTRFVCSEECIAHDKFKAAFIRANARDAQLSVQLDPRFPVIPVRALANKATEDFSAIQRDVVNDYDQGTLSQTDATLKIERFWAGALRRAVMEGDTETGSLMAGQSVGMVTQVQPMKEIMKELLHEAVTVLVHRQQQLRAAA